MEKKREVGTKGKREGGTKGRRGEKVVKMSKACISWCFGLNDTQIQPNKLRKPNTRFSTHHWCTVETESLSSQAVYGKGRLMKMNAG